MREIINDGNISSGSIFKILSRVHFFKQLMEAKQIGETFQKAELRTKQNEVVNQDQSSAGYMICNCYKLMKPISRLCLG